MSNASLTTITMSSTIINYSSAIESGLTTMLSQFGHSIVSQLSAHYKFDLDEAMRIAGVNQIGLEKKTKTAATEKAPKEKKEKAPKEPKEKKAPKEKVERLVPAFPLPFCGAIVEGWCNGVRANHELYTQCTAEPVAEDKFCKACRKAADGNDGSHPFGEISERLSKDAMDYEVKGKKVVPYGNVLAKIGKTREEAIAEAARFGWTIPEEQFETRKGSRGRPRANSDKSSGDETEKKARGRPRKEVEVVNGSAKGDDMIAQLIKNARAAEAAETPEQEVEEPVAVAVAEPVAVAVAEPVAVAVAEPVAVAAVAVADAVPEKKTVKKTKISKEDKEAEKAAKLAAKEAEKAAAKAAKEAEKAAAKAAKEAEKAAAKAAAKTEKPKKETKAKKAEPVVEDTPVAPLAAAAESEAENDEEEQIEVRPIKINGKNYLLATSGKFKGKLYDRATNKGIGMWNEANNKIEELPEDMVSEDEEEEEDE